MIMSIILGILLGIVLGILIGAWLTELAIIYDIKTERKITFKNTTYCVYKIKERKTK